MSDEPCQCGEDAAGWVLGALSDHEAERFAGHLRDCQSCRAEVARLSEASERLLQAVARVAPSPALRGRILAAVQDEARRFDAAATGSPAVEATRRVARRLLRTGLLVIAAGVIAAIGVLVWGGSGQPGDVRTVLGRVTLQGGAPRAHAVLNIRPRDATLVIVGLAAPPPGRLYQAWVLPRGSPAIPTGALFSPRSADTRIPLAALRRVIQVIVTAEAPPGSPTPTLPAIVVVDLGPPRLSAAGRGRPG